MTRNRAVLTLERRHRYLSRQIDERGNLDLPVDWARGERAAIAYAMSVIQDAEAVGLHRLGQLSLEEREVLRAAVARTAVAS